MTSGPAQPSSESERSKLIEQYEQEKEAERARHSTETARSARRRQQLRLGALVVVAAVIGLLALNRPAWLGPAVPPPPTPAEREASARFAIYIQAQQVEGFRVRRGRLPETLEEAGTPVPGVRYELLDAGRYTLRSEADPGVRFVSTDSLRSFLGGSLTLLGPAQ